MLHQHECQAQFFGGKNDGFTSLSSECPSPTLTGIVPFVGGKNSGFNVTKLNCPDAPVNMNNMFFGGNNGGFNFDLVNCSNLITNVYYGGSNDGFSTISFSSCLTQSDPSLYYGGAFDGFSSISASCSNPIPTGTIPFVGGPYDGFDVAINSCTTSPPISNIFYGGAFGGFDINASLCPPITISDIFSGGIYDGFATVSKSCIPSAPLSIDLIYFFSICNEKQVILLWEVESQINNDFFTVEKSRDGLSFDPIGTIAGEGTSFQHKSYSLIDEFNYEDLYYRLSQTDFDGTTTFFDIIKADCLKDFSEIIIYPNPNNGYFNILGAEFTEIFVYNALGDHVKTEYCDLNKMVFDLSTVSKGIYFLQFIKESTVTVKKIIIE
jgi:hypothetical protein